MKIDVKSWIRRPLFSAQLYFIAFMVISLLEGIDVLTTEKRDLVFQVKLNDANPQTDRLQENASIVHDYAIHLSSPGWYYDFAVENNIGKSPLSLITSLILCICGFIVSTKVDPNHFFKNDVSKPIFIAAAMIFIFFMIERYTYHSFRTTVLDITHQVYRLKHINNSWLLWTAIGLGWLGRMMKRGYQLQKDQELTI
jgi:hypothetical protein